MNVCATSFYLVKKLVTCYYSIQVEHIKDITVDITFVWLKNKILRSQNTRHSNSWIIQCEYYLSFFYNNQEQSGSEGLTCCELSNLEIFIFYVPSSLWEHINL